MKRMQTLGKGALGSAVQDVQGRLASLGYPIDPGEHGVFGETTQRAVREFQARRHLIVDGAVDEQTWDELVEAGYAFGDRVLYLRYPYFRGDDVRSLQASLNLLGFDAGREDGIFGERTDRGVHEFQRNVGLPPDGIVGVTTVEALRRLRPVAPGPGRATVREAEALRRLSATLRGARIAIDPGHGAGEPGVVGPGGTTEADASFLLATALSRELESRGAVPYLLRASGSNPAPAERARIANESGVEVLIALHLGSAEDESAGGAAAFYYGREDWHSQAGRRLAELTQEELTSQLGLADAGAHPKVLPILRETQMPAVHLEPLTITNPKEEAAVSKEAFRRDIARALADAVQRFFGGEAGTTVQPSEQHREGTQPREKVPPLP
jgi:N-acetylmuramoyl-L-alanine amidase